MVLRANKKPKPNLKPKLYNSLIDYPYHLFSNAWCDVLITKIWYSLKRQVRFVLFFPSFHAEQMQSKRLQAFFWHIKVLFWIGYIHTITYTEEQVTEDGRQKIVYLFKVQITNAHLLTFRKHSLMFKCRFSETKFGL